MKLGNPNRRSRARLQYVALAHAVPPGEAKHEDLWLAHLKVPRHPRAFVMARGTLLLIVLWVVSLGYEGIRCARNIPERVE